MIYVLDTLILISVSSPNGLLAIGGVNLLIWCEIAILIQYKFESTCLASMLYRLVCHFMQDILNPR